MYINAYLIPVADEHKRAYTRIANVFVDVVRDLGALEVFENWELDIPDGELTDYRRAVRAEPGEKIVLSWVVWPDRETGAAAHRRLPEDKRMQDLGAMPFDGKRMILGGFEPLVAWRKGQSERAGFAE